MGGDRARRRVRLTPPVAVRRAVEQPLRLAQRLLDVVRRSGELFVGMDGIDRSMALAAQAFSALFPLLIVVAAVTKSHDESLGSEINRRFGLSGDTASSIRSVLPGGTTVHSSITGLSVLILLVSALSFTRALQRLYERAWRLEARGMRGTPWGLLWLAFFSVYATLHPLLHDTLSGSLGLVASIAGAVLLWLLTPYIVLARRLPWRTLLPQAILVTVGMAALRVGSAIYMPRAMSSSAHQFGAIGLAFTLVSWLFAAALVVTGSAAMGATLTRRDR